MANADRAHAVEPGVVVRRAPFSDNPRVGARGLRTQQQILDAALRSFGDVGYHQTSIERIAREAGCSRIAFYQYFADKQDVFRHLAGRVDRQLHASIDRLGPVTPGPDGWTALRDWAGRYAEIRAAYAPVFRSFPAAAETDAFLAGASEETSHRYVAAIESRVADPTLAPRDLARVIQLCLECLGRTLDDAATLQAGLPDGYADDQVLDAFADVMHRSLFGLLTATNVHAHPKPRRAPLGFGPVMTAALAGDPDGTDAAPTGRARTALLETGREVFVERGFHGTRIDDLVAAAGVSHGAFYRYFKNKDELAHVLAAQAMLTVATTLEAMPGGDAERTELRRWLRRYTHALSGETLMIRVWVDATTAGDGLATDSAAAIDWGRRRMSRFLRTRGFGDADLDALVLLALIDALGVRERPAQAIDAALHIIERGFLGH